MSWMTLFVAAPSGVRRHDSTSCALASPPKISARWWRLRCSLTSPTPSSATISTTQVGTSSSVISTTKPAAAKPPGAELVATLAPRSRKPRDHVVCPVRNLDQQGATQLRRVGH